MGYYVINNLIKERINNMTQDEVKKIINSITDKNSLKAVQVAFGINAMQDVTIDKLIKLVASMDQNMKLLATKVLELEKRSERSSN
jgi:hypothetical protein